MFGLPDLGIGSDLTPNSESLPEQESSRARAFNIRTGLDQRLEKPRRPYLRLLVGSFATRLTGCIVSGLR